MKRFILAAGQAAEIVKIGLLNGEPETPEPFNKSEWRGVHMAVEAAQIKAAVDGKPLDVLVWQGLLEKIEKIVPFVTIDD